MKQFYIIHTNNIDNDLNHYELSARNVSDAMIYFQFYLLGARLRGDILSITTKSSRGISYTELNL